MTEAALKKKAKETFAAYVMNFDHRSDVEAALTVELMMEDPDRGHQQAYTKAMDVWEHMFNSKPAIGSVRGHVSAPYAIILFDSPEGEKIRMRIETCQRSVRIRSMRGTVTERMLTEQALKDSPYPAKFLRDISKRHRTSRDLTATMR